MSKVSVAVGTFVEGMMFLEYKEGPKMALEVGKYSI